MKKFILISLIVSMPAFAAPPVAKIVEVEKAVKTAFNGDYSKLNKKSLYRIISRKKDAGWDAGPYNKSFYLTVPHNGDCDSAVDAIFKINTVSDAKCIDSAIKIEFDE